MLQTTTAIKILSFKFNSLLVIKSPSHCIVHQYYSKLSYIIKVLYIYIDTLSYYFDPFSMMIFIIFNNNIICLLSQRYNTINCCNPFFPIWIWRQERKTNRKSFWNRIVSFPSFQSHHANNLIKYCCKSAQHFN